jgi:hypothetical protein
LMNVIQDMTKSRTATIQCSILKDLNVLFDSLTVFDLPEKNGPL